MVLAELSLELSTSQRQRSRWLDDARRDLGRRWDHEIEFLQQLRESLRYSRSYDADLDARSQRLRLEELLPRRLAQLRTGSNCFEVVDTLVEDGLRRHRVTLKRLASEQAAEERRKGEAGAP